MSELAEPRNKPLETVNVMQRRLVSMAQDGDDIAVAALVVQLRPGLARLARSVLQWPWTLSGSHRDACEDVQATFIESALKLDLERRGTRVAANLINDTRQRLWRASPAGWASGQQQSPPSLQSNDANHDHLGRSEAIIDLGRHLRNLDTDRASSIVTAEMAYLAWVQEYPLSDIAAQTGHTPGAVANRLHRLRRQLRTQPDDLAYLRLDPDARIYS